MLSNTMLVTKTASTDTWTRVKNLFPRLVDFTFEYVSPIAKQQNTLDCGVLVLSYIHTQVMAETELAIFDKALSRETLLNHVLLTLTSVPTGNN